jgi:pilus assembly protein CpaF
VTLQWPPVPAEHLAGFQPLAQTEPFNDDAHADGTREMLPDPPRAGLSDPRLIVGIAEITAAIAAGLDDGATATEVMPVIREATRRWLENNVRSGLLPASAGSQLDELAAAVHDRRYGLGPLSVYLRDAQVENVDINGCDSVWVSYATGERVAGPPVAASDDALIAMVRTWATRGGQTARDFSAAAPLVNVALSSRARLTATMSVTPRPCVSLRRHGQLDITLARLTQLGTVDTTIAAFLAAAVKSRCNIVITGGVNAGNTTFR